jgi:hypothetical protein
MTIPRITLDVIDEMASATQTTATATAMDAAIGAAPGWNGGPTGGRSAFVPPDLREHQWT